MTHCFLHYRTRSFTNLGCFFILFFRVYIVSEQLQFLRLTHWLILSRMENSLVTWTRVCGRCFHFSRSTIVHCTSSAVPGGIDLCVRCHSFVHPGCIQHASASHQTARPSCMLCTGQNATLSCPLCPSADGGSYGAQLCADCSAWLHAAEHKMCHVDHIVLLNG